MIQLLVRSACKTALTSMNMVKVTPVSELSQNICICNVFRSIMPYNNVKKVYHFLEYRKGREWESMYSKVLIVLHHDEGDKLWKTNWKKIQRNIVLHWKWYLYLFWSNDKLTWSHKIYYCQFHVQLLILSLYLYLS